MKHVQYIFQVFWLKDGAEIDDKGDVNFIVSSEGSLIINVARLSDSGNYTCGAQNIVTRRLSQTVALTVYGKCSCKDPLIQLECWRAVGVHVHGV